MLVVRCVCVATAARMIAPFMYTTCMLVLINLFDGFCDPAITAKFSVDLLRWYQKLLRCSSCLSQHPSLVNTTGESCESRYAVCCVVFFFFRISPFRRTTEINDGAPLRLPLPTRMSQSSPQLKQAQRNSREQARHGVHGTRTTAGRSQRRSNELACMAPRDRPSASVHSWALQQEGYGCVAG